MTDSLPQQPIDVSAEPALQMPLDDQPVTSPNAEPAWRDKPVIHANLVLEGGGMRCQFTAGILDFFMEQGLVFENVIGVSAGALSGMNYVSGLYQRTCLMNLKYCRDDRYLSLKSFLRTGNACGREFVFHTVLEEFEPYDQAFFTESPMRLTAVCSNLETGEAEYCEIKDMEQGLPYLIATSSLPFLSQPVHVDGKILLDGGTTDSIPFRYAMANGLTKNVVVLTRNAEYVKGPDKLRQLADKLYGDYPYYVERIEGRHFEYNRDHRKVAQLHEQGALFMMQPQKPVEVKQLERDQETLLDLYCQGYQVACENWPALKEYLEL